MDPVAPARGRSKDPAPERSEEFEALQRNEERLTLALAAGVVGTWDWHVADNKVFANERFARIYGVDPREAMLGAPVESFVNAIHPDDRARVRRRIEAAVAATRDFSEEYRLVQSDWTLPWVLARRRS